MTHTDLEMKMLAKKSTDLTQNFFGHLEDLDEEVSMVSSSCMTQLKVGPEFFTT